MSAVEDDIEEFFSKTDLDFSTVEGWDEFMAERRIYGVGRDADGLHRRYLKNYAVGTANIISVGWPVDMHFSICQPGNGLALAPATLYINYLKESGER